MLSNGGVGEDMDLTPQIYYSRYIRTEKNRLETIRKYRRVKLTVPQITSHTCQADSICKTVQ